MSLDKPILLSLGGRGIRGLATAPNARELLVVAGSEDDKPNFALYRWKRINFMPTRIRGLAFGTLSPEGIIVRPSGTVDLASDDGDRIVDGRRCGDWSSEGDDARHKRFRMVRVPNATLR